MLALSSSEMSPNKNSSAVQNNESSDDDSGPVQRIKKHVQRFSDSETEKEDEQINKNTVPYDVSSNNSENEPESNYFPFKSGTKSRIQMGVNSDSDSNEAVKNMEQQIRMKNKRNKLKNKFKSFLNSREKQSSEVSIDKQSPEGSSNDDSDPSDNEMSSISKIKQKIKKSMASMSSVCDPDTSDEETHMNKKNTQKYRQKQKAPKSTKMIEPKPIRMSAKQAMENMQLIKSESNRMLREKAVSLPYHRAKALSLKDIMSRRKPAVSSDGKALPIKMNEEQLKQYALLLEQRQKEMMELCKSESDEETHKDEETPETKETSEEIMELCKSKSDEETLKDEENFEDTPDTEDKCETSETKQKCNETDQNIDKMSASNSNVRVIIEKSNEFMENESIDTNANDVYVNNDLIKKDPIKISSTEEEIFNNDDDNSKIASELQNIDPNNQSVENDKNDSNTDLNLVYNDSVEDDNLNNINIVAKDVTGIDISDNNDVLDNNSDQIVVNSEVESQLISLHYTEKNTEELVVTEKTVSNSNENSDKMDTADLDDKQDDFFSDDDVNMEDIDKIIENAEILKDEENINSPMVIRDPQSLNVKPKLLGAPGMVIDLDGDSIGSRKRSGVELLKERFKYFAKLKTPEEMEREKEKTSKPGAQHLKLKQELEEKIAEQRSLEWEKRLEEEKQQRMEMETILDDAEDSFEKLEKEENESGLKDENKEESTSESEEEELEENDIEIKDKPRKRNLMVDDEAEESDCNENEVLPESAADGEPREDIDNDDDSIEEDDESKSSEEESSESEVDTTKLRKGRILKAFEDSDDEDAKSRNNETETTAKDNIELNHEAILTSNETQGPSQDDVLQLAQRHQSASDDLFTSQESCNINSINKDRNSASDEVLGTQTFSILESTTGLNIDTEFKSPRNLDALCMSQPYHDPNINAIVDSSQFPITQSSQSQPIGEDILALCTGKFYDNEFVSQSNIIQYVADTQKSATNDEFTNIPDDQVEPASSFNLHIDDNDTPPKEDNIALSEKENELLEDYKKADDCKKTNEDGNLRSILDELDDPEFDKPKINKFFTGGKTQQEETKQIPKSNQTKMRLIIDSEDETNETNLEAEQRRKKKLKKKKPEKRALQISDDEEEAEELELNEEEYMSDCEEDAERLVEYDSEENEIEVKVDKPKKKRKVADFFEQEAELTSEDEWIGSGDEDEKGLDRMEREEGDDEVFHQGKLRRELGQIHMRDVLDQDKREVRLIQELLFEDGDLGEGHRQRKFRWRNAGDDDENGAGADEFADTQEEEFESEEQWRKQRHEREVFLRQMQQAEEESANVSVNRTSIIKANLSSKSMSALLLEVNQSKADKSESPVVPEKKTAKDIPSPKKSFSILQQNYHGSLLTRGRGALARLAALATPLTADDDAPKLGSLAPHKRNFVFAALSQENEPKVTVKRKAEVNSGTPKLVKKMRIEDKHTRPNSSLLDHLNLL